MFGNWFTFTLDAAMLGLETQRVIGLRIMKVAAGGPDARAEMARMVNEKTAALAEATATLAFGGSAETVLRRYRTRVRANERRLSRAPSK